MSKLKIQIKSVFGNVLFEYEKENNTIKDALIEAVKSGANLSGANLSGADLRGAKLPIGRCKWSVSYTIEGVINIGCKSKTVQDWGVWFAGNEQFDTKRDTPEFEAIYKSYLMAKYAIEIGFY